MEPDWTQEERERYMALVMQLYYTGKNGDARRFAEEMTSTGVVGRIRAEEGNLCYSYFTSMDDPETVLLVDMWRDQEALDHHHASPMMGEIMKLREKYDLHMRAERCVTDDALSEHDQAFLRK